MLKKILPLCFFTTLIFASDIEKEALEKDAGDKYVEKNTGNFANGQTPSTAFGFGQWIVDEGTTTAYLYMDQEKGKNQNSVCVEPLVVYGIADYLSAYIALPIIVSDYTKGTSKARGIGDLFAQFEYVYWAASNEHRDAYATIVANMSVPTGSTPCLITTTTDCQCVSQKESLGYGVPTFFLGTTISMLSIKWYAYAEFGATLIPVSYQCTKTGNEFYYEWGGGYNLAGWKDNVLTLLFDFNGIYTQKDKSNGISDNDTGGNIMWAGPTLFYSHKTWAFSAGIQGSLFQHWNGDQPKQQFRTILAISTQF